MSTGVGSQSQEQDDGKTGISPTVQVSRAVAAPIRHVWEVLVSPAGAQALLGEGATLGAKGEPYQSVDGANGVLRSYHPLEQLRVSWHERPDSPPSIVEIDLRADGERTHLDLTQAQLRGVGDLSALNARWSAALDAVAARAEG